MKITNIQILRDELIEAYEMVKKDPRRIPQGKEMGNIAGKIINSAKLQLDYASITKTTPKIPFLEV